MAERKPSPPDCTGRASSERQVAETSTAPEGLRGNIELLRGRLGSELTAARHELGECRQEAERLRERLANFEGEHQLVCRNYEVLEEQIAELGNLFVVMERIHSTLDHREVLAVIQDLVVNIIGSEELAVYTLAEGDRELRPVQAFGVESRHLGPVAMGAGPVGRAAAERRSWVVGDGPPPPEYPDLTACAPLEISGHLVGVLVIWRMLGHKPVFGAGDRKVLELLVSHAAQALYLTGRLAQGRARAA